MPPKSRDAAKNGAAKKFFPGGEKQVVGAVEHSPGLKIPWVHNHHPKCWVGGSDPQGVPWSTNTSLVAPQRNIPGEKKVSKSNFLR